MVSSTAPAIMLPPPPSPPPFDDDDDDFPAGPSLSSSFPAPGVVAGVDNCSTIFI